MSDAFVQLRKDLLADRPSLKKYMAKKSFPRTTSTNNSVSSMRQAVPSKPVQKRTLMKLNEDPEGFMGVPPRNVNNEEDVFKHRGKKYKRVVYGPDSQFLVHKGLNPPPKYSTTICSDNLEDLGNKKSLLMAAREAKAQEALKRKNVKGEESEARRDELRNMTTYKSGVVDDLVKQNRAKTSWILRNADRATTDQLEEMRDFYGHVGSTQSTGFRRLASCKRGLKDGFGFNHFGIMHYVQVLAMRELQIEDNKHLKDIGVKSGEIYFQDVEDREKGRPSEYEDMVERRASLLKKNRQIVDVMKNQVLEKEMLRNLEVEENLENALRLDALTEAELAKRMNEKEAEEREKQKHFDTFTAITNYRDYLRGVRVAEEEALWQREKDFLEQKAKFNEAYQAKMDRIKADRQRLVSTVRADLGASYEKQEQQEMEYYYTLQKERDIQIEDQEIQEKLDKKAAMEELMRDWGKITEANKLIKQQHQMRENEEKERMKKFLELENNAKKAEERKRLVEKDINRMEIMYQINERERKRQEEAEAKAREIKLLRAEGFVREGKLKDRMVERMDDFKNNGLPERFLSNIRKHYNLYLQN